MNWVMSIAIVAIFLIGVVNALLYSQIVGVSLIILSILLLVYRLIKNLKVW